MNCLRVTSKVFTELIVRRSKSHKGQNGTVLVIAGSKQYHGSLVFAAVTASRLVDLVWVVTHPQNRSLVKALSPEFIVYDYSKAVALARQADIVLVGPGLEKKLAMKKIILQVLKLKKKTVLDATALRLIPPKELHNKCVVTPHADEFRQLFGVSLSRENVVTAAKKYNCIILAKGKGDMISNGTNVYCNFTGNAQMTTGGTGDLLAGLVTGFGAKNDLLASACAAAYLNGFAAQRLARKMGAVFNAQDLMNELPMTFKAVQGALPKGL